MFDSVQHDDSAQDKRRWIVSLARESAYVPKTRNILARLGYAIVPLQEWLAEPQLLMHRPELAIVEERSLADFPSARELDQLPIVLLTGRQGIGVEDPRVVAGVPVPAGLHELYRVLQQALERTPRSCLRVPTEIKVRIRQQDREWEATLRSLSENGCLLRSQEPLAMETPMHLSFDLPRLGRVETAAEPTYQFLPDTGIVFQRTTPGHRRSIQIFVEKSIL